MLLFSVMLFVFASIAAVGAIASSVRQALPRIDAVIASRGSPIERTIRLGKPRSGFKLA